MLDFEPDPMPSTQEMRRYNDELGLTDIAKFGWLRPREIGNVLWAKNKTRHVAGARIARRWHEERLVIERSLPYGLGNAYVLSQRGAEYVSDETPYGAKCDVKSGKKIGDHIRQSSSGWVPTLSWRHDLLSNGFLTLVMGHGGRVVSELELRRESEPGVKIPDGLYSSDSLDMEWLAIETERAGKWSTSAKAVAASIVESALNSSYVCGRRVVGTVLVYEDPMKRHWRDDSRPISDHLGRMVRQCKAIVPMCKQFNLVGIPLVTSGGAVIDISQPVQKVVGWSFEATIEKSIYTFRWHEFEGSHRLHLPESVGIAVYIKEYSGEWIMRVFIPGQSDTQEFGLGDIKTVQAARQLVLKKVLRLPEYRAWAEDNIEFLHQQLQE